MHSEITVYKAHLRRRTAMFAAGMPNPGDIDLPHPAFVLVSITLWGFFTNSVIAASRTLKAGEGFINQASYPQHTMLIKELLRSYCNFLIRFVCISRLLACFSVSLPGLQYATPLDGCLY
jgi:lipopolysaccharide transport system permease protein